jgi:hypothetical protein
MNSMIKKKTWIQENELEINIESTIYLKDYDPFLEIPFGYLMVETQCGQVKRCKIHFPEK